MEEIDRLATEAEQDAADAGELSLSVEEVVRLGAVDAEFFAKTLLPKTYRQPSPTFARRIWGALENPAYPFVNLQCFRGSAKTTRLRTFVLRRIAYRVSRTIMFIGGSETAASRSVSWLRLQIEKNKTLTSIYGLRPGAKWNETELEIVSTVDGTSTWVTGMGISANIRGLNFEDFRPDLIACDDILTDENVLTQESREKTTDILLGAIAGSLISRVEEPNAKLCVLQTPLHQEDASMKAAQTESWHTQRISCWTEETEDAPLEERRSSWEEMFPTEQLRKTKQDYAALQKSHIFSREFEIRIVSPEASAFRPRLLRYYDKPPTRGTSVLAIDPVPPPTDLAVRKNLYQRDYEAISVLTRSGGNYYLRHYEQSRGHNPSWTLAKVFELAMLYQVSYIAVEVVAYQAVLQWLITQEMSRRSQFYSVLPIQSGRKSKYQRIVDTIMPLMALGKFYILPGHTDFISQLTDYPSIAHDDLLDSVTIGLRALINPALENIDDEEGLLEEGEFSEPLLIQRCP